MYQNREERAKSYFYKMRYFHNCIKRDLYNKYTKNINNLLDLACGKCGDLDKWVSNNIKNVVGYDINEMSIKEGERRINNYKHSGKLINTKINLHVMDLSLNIVDSERKCDVISSMFAFHYFFKSKETMSIIMDTINNNLRIGGYFIGTMFDGELINNILKENDIYELSDNNDVKFRLKIDNDNGNKLYGNKLSVYLKDTVLDEPMDEYIVNFEEFVNDMKRRGYELVDSRLFSELYDELNYVKLNEIEKKVSFLNRTFVFKSNGCI